MVRGSRVRWGVSGSGAAEHRRVRHPDERKVADCCSATYRDRYRVLHHATGAYG